jgi:hypothetical protein
MPSPAGLGGACASEGHHAGVHAAGTARGRSGNVLVLWQPCCGGPKAKGSKKNRIEEINEVYRKEGEEIMEEMMPEPPKRLQDYIRDYKEQSQFLGDDFEDHKATVEADLDEHVLESRLRMKELQASVDDLRSAVKTLKWGVAELLRRTGA